MRASIRSIGRGVAVAALVAATVSCGDVARTVYPDLAHLTDPVL